MRMLRSEGLEDGIEQKAMNDVHQHDANRIKIYSLRLCTRFGGNSEAQPQLPLTQSTQYHQCHSDKLRIGRGQECERRMLAVSVHSGSDAMSSSRLARLPPTPLSDLLSQLHTLIHVGHPCSFGDHFDIV
ncbi:hypothetical protein BLNAU_19392 [Blattamonas nauphoetae]|uniref:Uncharacterized protein n=1 Tax=Blattamonas nauphoetae TaxID=2049346 RepID=A0ABQ9X245_9EUKA|nr:hypothetical protein BLNAU_19392 [Blattamonas nauphoetae]